MIVNSQKLSEIKRNLFEMVLCLAGLTVATFTALCLGVALSNPELTQTQVLSLCWELINAST